MELNPKQKRIVEQLTRGSLLSLFLFKKLPMAWIAGLRVRQLDSDTCVTSIPYKKLNSNPFKSTYFAVQSMGAEFSTAVSCTLAVTGKKPSIALIIVDLKANFSKKAIDRIYFTCNDGKKAFDAVEKCINTGEAEIATLKTTGRMKDGTVVSEFEFTWSFKQRSS
ncbi:MAG: thioesterase [Cyclobacteriaceae bacterium]